MNEVSIILTIHNKAWLIERILKSIISTISEQTKEIVCVFDGCTDDSEKIVDRVAEKENYKNIVKTYTPDVYEIRANRAGIDDSHYPYACLIQDDMEISQKDFDLYLMKPLEKISEVFCVSGRDAHNIVLANNQQGLAYPDLMGWSNKAPLGIFYIRDVINRGPIMIEKKRYYELGGFNEDFCPTNQDDHDICLRAYEQHGWLCGSYWINYYSPPDWGTSRVGKNIDFQNQAMAKNWKLIAERHGEQLLKPKHNKDIPL